MRLTSRLCIVLTLFGLIAFALARDVKETRFRLDSTKDLTMIGGKAEPVTYKGRGAVHLVPAPSSDNSD